MLDSLADSSLRLGKLLELVTKETDPIKCDEIAAEIRRVLDERELHRNSVAITKQPEQETNDLPTVPKRRGSGEVV